MVLLFMSIYLTKRLGFTFEQAGFVLSAFGLGALVGTFLGGKLSDLIGFYYVMFLSLVLSGVLFILLIYIKSFESMCLVVFLTSLFAEMYRPANYVAIKSYSKQENQTRSLALNRLAINLGFSVAPALGGFIAYQIGFNWLFVLDGATCILAGIMFYFLLPKKESKKKQEDSTDRGRLAEVFRNTKYMWYLGFVFLSSITFMQLFTTIPVYLKDHFLLNESQIGLLLALNGILIVIIEMPLIYMIENKFSSLRLIASGCLLFALSYAFFLWGSSALLIAVIFMILITIGEMINFPFSTSWALNQSNERNAGQYMALYSMTFASAYIVAPSLGFRIIAYQGYTVLWTVMTVMAVVGGLGFLLLRQKELN